MLIPIVVGPWVAAAIVLALRHLGFATRPKQALAIAVLGLTTALPFFINVILPDVFAGLIPIALIMLIGFWLKLSRSERVFWVVNLIVTVTFHKAFLATAVVMLPVACMCFVRSGIGSIVAIGAIGIGCLAILVEPVITKRVLGALPIEPPFLLARTIADGTTAQVLRDDCAVKAYKNCAFVSELPLTEEQYLWPSLAKPLAWAGLKPSDRRALAAEQTDLVISSLANHPLMQVERSAVNSARQFMSVGIADFQFNRAVVEDATQAHFDTELKESRASRIWQGEFPIRLLSYYWSATYAISVGLVAVMLFWRRRLIPHAERRVIATAVVLLTGLWVNAMIDGVLSGVFDRYQGRVAWLATFSALILLNSVDRGITSRRRR